MDRSWQKKKKEKESNFPHAQAVPCLHVRNNLGNCSKKDRLLFNYRSHNLSLLPHCSRPLCFGPQILLPWVPTIFAFVLCGEIRDEKGLSFFVSKNCIHSRGRQLFLLSAFCLLLFPFSLILWLPPPYFLPASKTFPISYCQSLSCLYYVCMLLTIPKTLIYSPIFVILPLQHVIIWQRKHPLSFFFQQEWGMVWCDACIILSVLCTSILPAHSITPWIQRWKTSQRKLCTSFSFISLDCNSVLHKTGKTIKGSQNSPAPLH